MLEILKNYNIDKNLYTIVHYNKNDCIFNEGDIAEKIGFVESGIIKISTITYLDNEFEISRIEKNGFFGSFLVFSNNNKYAGNARALTNTDIIYFTKENFLKALENRQFLEFYLTKSSTQILSSQKKLKTLSQHSIKEKILFLLQNNYQQNNTKIFKFKNKQILANYLNIPRPSLSRVLIELKTENIIDYDKNTITLL